MKSTINNDPYDIDKQVEDSEGPVDRLYFSVFM